MTKLEQFKKRRKQLKAEIKEARSHLKNLKKELKTLRETQQHNTVDRLDDLAPRPSTFKAFLRLFRK